MNRPSPARDAVLQLLKDHGSLSCREMAEELGRPISSMSSLITRLRQSGVPIRIACYRHQPDGRQGSLVPVYALGTEPDSQYPRLPSIKTRRRVYNRKYRQRHYGKVYLKNKVRQGQEVNPFTMMIRSLTT